MVQWESFRIMITLGIGTQGVHPFRARCGGNRSFPASLDIGTQRVHPFRARCALFVTRLFLLGIDLLSHVGEGLDPPGESPVGKADS